MVPRNMRQQILSRLDVNWVIAGLLAGILVTQVGILIRLPTPAPTLAEMRKAKGDKEQLRLFERIPLIRIQGGSIDADVTNGSFDVWVQNTPLEVEVYR